MSRLLFILVLLPCFSFGQIIFQKSYDFYGIPYGVTIAENGDYIISGQVDFDQGFITRIDSLGNEQWTKTYSISDHTEIIFMVSEIADGLGYIGCGSYVDNLTFKKGLLLFRLTNNGDTVWTLSSPTISATYYQLHHMLKSSDGFYYMVGAWGFQDIPLLKIDTVGNLIWAKHFGGPQEEVGDYIIETNDGSIVVFGATFSYSVTPTADAYLMKLDVDGNEIWSKVYGGSLDEYGHCIKQTSDGGFITLGHTATDVPIYNWDVFLMKLDSVGDTLWVKAFGTPNKNEEAHELEITADGGFAFTVTAGGGAEVFLVKTDQNGNLQWVRGYPMEFGGAVTLNSFKKTSDGGFILVGHRNQKLHVIKTDPEGRACDEYNPTFQERVPSFTIGTGWDTVPAANYQPTVLTPSPIFPTDTTYCDTTFINTSEYSVQFGIEIYPNPTTGTFTVQGKGTVEVYDLFGRLILTSTEPQIDLSTHPKGVYVVKVGEAVRKLVLN